MAGTVALDAITTLLVASAVLAVGRWVNGRVGFLTRFSIPDPITGGLLFTLVATLLRRGTGFGLHFDQGLSTPLLLAFFATIGLSANLATLRQGGPRLLLFLGALLPFLILQNALGFGLAQVLGTHPAIGLTAGSITLVGGHGTGAAYAQTFAETHNIEGVLALAMTSATLGLILGGILGGPMSELLLPRVRGPRGVAEALTDPGAATGHAATPTGMLVALGLIFASMTAGTALARLAAGLPITVPSFVWCLLVGLALSNGMKAIGLSGPSTDTVELLGTVALSLFLALAMMAIRAEDVLGLAGPLLVILAAQAVFAAAWAALVVFPVLGRSYDAAVMSGGFIGFAMGATATAIANMQAVTKRHGPSPAAFLIVPLVGAFFIDLMNALVLTGYLSLPDFTL